MTRFRVWPWRDLCVISGPTSVLQLNWDCGWFYVLVHTFLPSWTWEDCQGSAADLQQIVCVWKEIKVWAGCTVTHGGDICSFSWRHVALRDELLHVWRFDHHAEVLDKNLCTLFSCSLQLAAQRPQHEAEDHPSQLHSGGQRLLWQTCSKTGSAAGRALPVEFKASPTSFEMSSSYPSACCAFQFKKGGPIIAVQVENEYGSFAKDQSYMLFLKEVKFLTVLL